MRAPCPLRGRRILVTRRPEQSAELTRRLTELGAVVIEVPTIRIAPPQDTSALDLALRSLEDYQWVVFTSANAVEAVRDRLQGLGLSFRALLERRLASVGPATTESLRAAFPGAAPLQPERDFRAEGLLRVLCDLDCAGRRFLIPTSDRSSPLLPEGLRARGATVTVLAAYRTLAAPDARPRLKKALRQGIDLAAFASPSAVEGFVAALGKREAAGVPAAVIGPATETAARKAGLPVLVRAESSTVEGWVAAVTSYLAPAGRAGRAPS